MELENSYTTSELEDLLDVRIDRTKSSADPCGRALGSPNSIKFNSIIEITINLPLTSRYLDMTYLEKVQINEAVYKQVCDSFPNLVGNKYYIENTRRGHPHIHGYLDLLWDHPIYVQGLLMDIAKVVLKQLSKGQYRRQYTKANYNDKLERFKSSAVCLNYKRILGEKWLSYITKDQKHEST